MYKVVTKIIVKRLRPFLPKLISPLQTTFVLERMGLDNMIIAQELIHTMTLKKGKTGFMAIKIDLEKVIDLSSILLEMFLSSTGCPPL